MKLELTSEEIQKRRAIDTHSSQASEFSTSYDELERDAYTSCFTYSRMRLNGLLEGYLPKRGDGQRLLDVGCGTGHHLMQFRERGFDVTGVDGSEGMLEVARANNPGIEFAVSDVEALPFPDQSFDLVICIEVLRYLPHFSKCVREMGRVLRPGGVCLTTATPILNLNGYYFVNRVAAATKVSDLVPLRQYFTTSGKLRREFEEAGFDPNQHSRRLLRPGQLGRASGAEASGFISQVLAADRRCSCRPATSAGAFNMFLVKATKK